MLVILRFGLPHPKIHLDRRPVFLLRTDGCPLSSIFVSFSRLVRGDHIVWLYNAGFLITVEHD